MTIVFIDAENVSVSEFNNTYKQQILNLAEQSDIDVKDIKYRAYAVEGGHASNSWHARGVKKNIIPGKPAKDKADKRIEKELGDSANGKNYCFVVTKDKKMRNRIRNVEKIDGVEFFGC